MNSLRRTLIACAILLSGLAMIPYATLPSEGFEWQRFASVYEPTYSGIVPRVHLPMVTSELTAW